MFTTTNRTFFLFFMLSVIFFIIPFLLLSINLVLSIHVGWQPCLFKLKIVSFGLWKNKLSHQCQLGGDFKASFLGFVQIGQFFLNLLFNLIWLMKVKIQNHFFGNFPNTLNSTSYSRRQVFSSNVKFQFSIIIFFVWKRNSIVFNYVFYRFLRT